jgi:hypothetical protein
MLFRDGPRTILSFVVFIDRSGFARRTLELVSSKMDKTSSLGLVSTNLRASPSITLLVSFSCLMVDVFREFFTSLRRRIWTSLSANSPDESPARLCGVPRKTIPARDCKTEEYCWVLSAAQHMACLPLSVNVYSTCRRDLASELQYLR